MPDYRRRRRTVLFAAIATLAIVVLIGIQVAPQLETSPTKLATLVITSLRQAGPVVFFGAMGLLPVIGFPLAPFNLAAGPAFAPTLGLVPVILLAVAAISLNVALTYWLSRWALRPLVERAASWLGYAIPEIPHDKHLPAAFLVRATPGPPFFLQSCLLGLARVRFGSYMVASCTIPGLFAMLCIIGGDALMKGNTRLVLLAFGALGALALALKLLRKAPAQPKT
jgi:uncharacterized membrane protein YdjX (TVP38/TMEM64 family)